MVEQTLQTRRGASALIIASVAALTLIFGISTWTLYTLFYPYEIIRVDPSSFAVQQSVVARGDQVIVRLKFCKYSPVVNQITTTLIGPVLVPLPPNQMDLAVGCYDTKFSLATIPDATPVGTYKVRATYRYKLNFLREVTYQFETDEFAIK